MKSPPPSDCRVRDALEPKAWRQIGRYVMSEEIATGGAGTVHLGRVCGSHGFSRTVAIKRLHPQFSRDPEFVARFLDEARLAGRVRHANVVSPIDLCIVGGEPFIVMDFVEGETLGELLRLCRLARISAPLGAVANVMCGVLNGLHAVHEALGENGRAMNIVHRDVSPQNIMVGCDGIARILDFGAAKATMRLAITRDGDVKGKLGYMAPEQLSGSVVDRRADVFAAGVVLWEALTMSRLFRASTATETLSRLASLNIPGPSRINATIRPELDAVVLRALSRNPAERFATAAAFAQALEQAVASGTRREVGGWVKGLARCTLERHAVRLAESESSILHFRATPELHNGNEASLPSVSPLPTVLSLPTLTSLTTQRAKPRKFAALAATIAFAVCAAFLCLNMYEHSPLPVASVTAAANARSAALEPSVGRKRAQHVAPAITVYRSNENADLRTALPRTEASTALEVPPLRVPPRAGHSASKKLRKLAAKPTLRARKSCRPPFYMDAKGIRRLKRYCMK